MIALITGVGGQDGSYLAELLLEKGYEVHGMVRRASCGFINKNIKHLLKDITIHYGEMTDKESLDKVLKKSRPHEIYNLAAQSDVGVSFAIPTYTMDVNAKGVFYLLDLIRCSKIKLFQASTSELFGNCGVSPQTEKTPFVPRSPYAISKLAAYWAVLNNREGYNTFACNGISMNHESPRRGPGFVTQKIVGGMYDYLKHRKTLKLGNLNATRDWGHAKDYVRAFHAILQQKTPDDFVLSTGRETSVREFCSLAASYFGVQLEWTGSGKEEKGLHNGRVAVEVSADFYRPTECNGFIGDSSKAIRVLGWQPEITLEELVAEMCEAACK